ncbi:MAG: double-strand break repair helicase AddA [Alphaproteobacteria bacterium]|nr:double-strand break repair helicase AddA [Alphaproteobacteria bacterium]
MIASATTGQRAHADQHQASDPAVSVWVSASAGTGKTKVLTDRMLRLLIAGSAPNRLLCITFTKAAAAEMANRLNRRLAAWATMHTTELDRDLKELLGGPPDDATLIRARRLFALVLDAPGGLRIQTIHSFAQTILGRFPLEAGLAPGFQVLQDTVADSLLDQAINASIEAASLDGTTTDLDRLVARLPEDRFRTLMAGLVSDRGRFADAIQRYGGLDGWTAALARYLDVPAEIEPDTPLLQLLGPTRDAADFTWAAGLLSRGGKTEQRMAEALVAVRDAPDRLAQWDLYRSIFLTTENTRRARTVSKALAAAQPDLVAWVERETDAVERALDQRQRAETLVNSRAAARLTSVVLSRYQQLKRQRVALDFDDLILATRQVLTTRGGAAWVLFKLDGGLDHVLIDEAQDTNPDQWRIVAQLVEEFAAGRGRAERPRTLFVVGDPKQSIYSFQRADLAVFEAMRRQFEQRFQPSESAFQPRWRSVALQVSFRSSRAVLALVDQVFADGPARQGVPASGAHIPHRAEVGGSVELWPLAEPEAMPDLPEWQPPVAHPLPDIPKLRLAKALAGHLATVIGREVLAETGRPITPGDVLVLVRSRDDFVDLLIRELKRAGVPVAGSDRMALTSQIGVEDLLALLRVVLLPEDDLSLACLLRSPLIGMSEEALMQLAGGRADGTHLIAALMADAEATAYATAANSVRHWLARADAVPPFEFLCEVLGRDRGRHRLLGRLGSSALDPVDELLNLALRYEALGPPTLQGFLAWIDTSAIEIKRDSDTSARAVRIMTVHGAKGLEAPLVVLADAYREPVSVANAPMLLWPGADAAFSGPIWSPSSANADPVTKALYDQARERQLEEHNRLLYVALTRARDRLIICGVKGKREPIRQDYTWWASVAAGLTRLEGVESLADAIPGLPGVVRRYALANTGPARFPAASSPHRTATPPPAWLHQPPPPEPPRPRPLAPSRPIDLPALASPISEGRTTALRRGRLIHRLLQVLPEVPADQHAAQAQRIASRAIYGLAPTEQSTAVAEALRVLGDARFAAVFGPHSRAEVPVVGDVNGYLVNGRIDRLAVLPSHILLVDLKTDRPAPTSIDGVGAGHLHQLALYRALLTALYPDRPVEAALLWTDGPHLMPIPADRLDQHVPTVPNR